MALTKITLSGAIDTIKQGFTKLNNLIDDLLSTSNGLGASVIGLEDAAGNLDAKNLEDAVTEIYTDHSTTRTLAETFDENPDTTTGLTWGYLAGVFRDDNTVTVITAGTISLTDDATNYVEIDPVDTTVKRNTTAFTAGRVPLREVVCSSGNQDTSTDKRAWFVGMSEITATKVTINNTSEPAISINQTNISGTDNQAIDISVGEALEAGEHWTGIRVKPDALDPSGADAVIRGVAVNLSGVDITNNPQMDGVRVSMPANSDRHAIHIIDGVTRHDYSSSTAAGAEFTPHGVIVDGTNLDANSTIHVYDVQVANGAPSGTVCALGTHSNVHPVCQTIGTFTSPSQTEYAGRKTGGGTTWADGIDTNEIFAVNGDEVYIGAVAQFAQIEVIMTSDATKNIVPTFWYNTAADTWTQFFPSDSTNGFQTSATIFWTLGDISGSWTNDGDPGGADTTAGYWIKIIRTAAPDPGTPTPTTMKTGTVTIYEWDKDGDVSVKDISATDISATSLGLGTLTTLGDLWVRGAAVPERLAAGADGTVLKGTGAGALPAYEAIASELSAVGGIITKGAAGDVDLVAGAVGTILKGKGAGVLPAYEDFRLDVGGFAINSFTKFTSGDTVVTGVGFEPSLIIFFSHDQTTTNKNWSIGTDTGSIAIGLRNFNNGTETGTVSADSISIQRDTSNKIFGNVTAKGADGFTITFTLTGTCYVIGRWIAIK